MRRRQSYFVFLLLMLLVSLSGCSTVSTATGQRKENQTSSVDKTATAYLCLYVPDRTGQLLQAVSVQTTVKESIERTILEQLLPRLGFAQVRVLSLTAQERQDQQEKELMIKLTNQFFTRLSAIGQKRDIILAAITNSLTELPGIKGIYLESATGGTPHMTQTVKSVTIGLLRRDRSRFPRDKSLNPSQVLHREMTYEQQGRWLDAYLLMSDADKNPHKKYYDAFYRELEEMKAMGFLYTDFRINGYKISKSGDKARVEVEVIPRINTSYAQYVDKVWFSTVKVENVWMVDWLTTQNP